MKRKRIFYCELAYFLGIVVLAFGTALMEKADFGMSMVVAPAYLIHLKISEYVPWFSFGMSEYAFQALLLILLSVVMHKFKKSYILSFATAFLYGTVLDIAMKVVALFPYSGLVWQVIFYIAGLIICAVGVALLLHTYFPPEAYELAVKELSLKFNVTIGKTKTIYDCCSCALAIVLSLCFFKAFVGVKWGTIACAIINGWLIGKFSQLLESKFILKDAFPWRNKLQ
jgi:uncharacterized membrane protein YczE